MGQVFFIWIESYSFISAEDVTGQVFSYGSNHIRSLVRRISRVWCFYIDPFIFFH